VFGAQDRQHIGERLDLQHSRRPDLREVIGAQPLRDDTQLRACRGLKARSPRLEDERLISKLDAIVKLRHRFSRDGEISVRKVVIAEDVIEPRH
jgi:hypothetical protein